MKRKDYVPLSIAAGCDMFLFFNDPDEDFGYMMDGYKNGVITEERMNDALQRILGLKASLGLHTQQQQGTLIPPKEGLKVVNCDEHKAMGEKAADLGITLVKNNLKSTPDKTQYPQKDKIAHFIRGTWRRPSLK